MCAVLSCVSVYSIIWDWEVFGCSQAAIATCTSHIFHIFLNAINMFILANDFIAVSARYVCVLCTAQHCTAQTAAQGGGCDGLNTLLFAMHECTLLAFGYTVKTNGCWCVCSMLINIAALWWSCGPHDNTKIDDNGARFSLYIGHKLCDAHSGMLFDFSDKHHQLPNTNKSKSNKWENLNWICLFNGAGEQKRWRQ